jgi:hypothetical protein
MSTPQIILWATALVVGVPSAWKNPTAGALVLAFVVSQFGLAHVYYAFPDAFTIFVIAMKNVGAGSSTPADRFILLSLPLGWIIYVLEGQIPHFYWWYALWFLALAQFAAAGLEPAIPFIRRRYAEAAKREPPFLQRRMTFAEGGSG